MTDRLVITQNDFERLKTLIAENRPIGKGHYEISDLDQKLDNAVKVAPEKVSRGIVTMNSCVLLRDVKSGRESEVTITYPHLADNRARRVSVLSTVGLLLFGRKEREIVSWRIPEGVGNFEIVKVTYQPEAAGDFNL